MAVSSSLAASRPYRSKGSRIGAGHHELRHGDQRGGHLVWLDAVADPGINFVDAADVYGDPKSPDMSQDYGISKEYIGEVGNHESAMGVGRNYGPITDHDGRSQRTSTVNHGHQR